MSDSETLPGLDPALLASASIRVRSAGPVLTITLDRPAQRNAQTPATWRALAAIGAFVADTPSVRVVVLAGAGASFSAGLDRAMFSPAGVSGEPSLAELAGLDDDALDCTIAGFQEGFACWSQVPAVTIAAVQGHAVGAGFQLALACDLRILTDDAQLAMRETSLGLVPDLTGTWPLVRAVGPARALEICATGRWVGAAEAAAIGLATAVVPGSELTAAVEDLAAALIAAPEGALRETLLLLRGASERTRGEQYAAERAAQARRLRALVGGHA